MNFFRQNNTTGMSSRANSASAFILKLFLGLFLLAMVGMGCSGSKSLAKKAGQLEEAGLYANAADYYYNALMRNNNNIDARIGLTKTAQRVLNDKFDDFTRARAMDEHRKAVEAYLDADAYREKVQRLGVRLEAPDYLKEDYEASKLIYVQELYNRGNDLMADKKFDEANALFKQISKLSPGYKDIAELKDVSLNEPLYTEGSSFFDNAAYRKAYYKFDEVYRNNPNYKDVAVLRAECLDLGKFPVAIMPFENTSNVNGAEKRVRAYVITELTSLDDPFLRIIERENMEAILQEQRLSLSGVVNESTAARVGNLLGANVMITGNVISYSTKPGRMRQTKKDGFEAYQVKLYDKVNDKNYYETRYKPVTYFEYYNRNEVSVSFQYKGISLETGEVLFSNVVDKSLNDEVYYAAYDGEITKLFPASAQGVITSNRERNQLTSLLRANRTIKGTEQLTNAAFEAAAEEVAQDVKTLLLK
jgi:hypothetical protein